MASEGRTAVKHLTLFALLLSLAIPLLASSEAAGQVKPPSGKPPSEKPPSANPPPDADRNTAATPIVIASPNYEVGPNDRLRITVWNQEDVSGEYVVSGDGSFTFPLIGRVTAAGLTLSKLEAELKQLLAAGFFRNPQVTAAVIESTGAGASS